MTTAIFKVSTKVFYEAGKGFLVAVGTMSTLYGRDHLSEEPTKIVGHFESDISPGDVVTVVGDFEDSQEHGKQFVATAIRLVSDCDYVCRELLAGNVQGVNPELGRRIVRTLQEETLDVIRNSPRDFMHIKGIAKGKAAHVALDVDKKLEKWNGTFRSTDWKL